MFDEKLYDNKIVILYEVKISLFGYKNQDKE